MTQYLQHQSILANKKKQHSVKEEVATVLLSAMMGYIIERWESEPAKIIPEVIPEQEITPNIEISIDIPLSVDEIEVESMNESKPTTFRKRKSSSAVKQKLKKKKSSSSKMLSISKQESVVPSEELILPTIIESSSKERLLSQDFGKTSLKDILDAESYQSLSNRVSSQTSSKTTGSDDFMVKLMSEWRFLENDQQTVIHFKQGNRYRGLLSRSNMYGTGMFNWADGSKYEGDFEDGEITGKGILKWSDQCWYEGSFYKGYRHGHGLLVLNNYMCYIGNWYLGYKHGLGYINYKDPQIQLDYYNGEWSFGLREGTGLRHYSSGARYSGQWQNNCRHGLGTMVWTNNDVYSGNWNNGEIDGYGEYTWNTFFNKQLVVPQENCYYGMWKKGIREGNGILELASGAIIRGCWCNGLKHGPAEVVCTNGTFVKAHDLFINDCVSEISDSSSQLSDESVAYEKSTATLYHIPINSPSHDIDLTVYTKRLVVFKDMRRNINVPENIDSCQRKQKAPVVDNIFSKFTINVCKTNEEKWLRKVINFNLKMLKGIYKMYAEIGCSDTVNFQSVLTRFMLWQLWRDCGFHKRGLSLADIDIIVASNPNTLMDSTHYPFERIQFWQFLHCIIELSWHFYILNFKECVSKIPAILASALNRLIRKDILPNVGNHVGNALFKCRDLISIDGAYWLYRGLGETLSARKFIKAIMIPDYEEKIQIPNYPSFALQGANAFGVGGQLMYLQGEVPLTYKEPPINEREVIYSEPLSSLRDIGKKRAVRNLISVCPSIKAEGLFVNIDYQLVFLEFYELLLLSAISSIKKTLWIQKREEEREQERLQKIENEKLMLLEKEIKLKKTKSEDKKKTVKSQKKRTA